MTILGHVGISCITILPKIQPRSRVANQRCAPPSSAAPSDTSTKRGPSYRATRLLLRLRHRASRGIGSATPYQSARKRAGGFAVT
jgi:hypothetical protein